PLAERGETRPARIGGNEGEVAAGLGTVALVAQDDPLNELAGDGVGNLGFDPGGIAGAAAAQGVDRLLDQRDVRVRGFHRRRLGQRRPGWRYLGPPGSGRSLGPCGTLVLRLGVGLFGAAFFLRLSGVLLGFAVLFGLSGVLFRL